jgi:hypothetical protein
MTSLARAEIIDRMPHPIPSDPSINVSRGSFTFNALLAIAGYDLSKVRLLRHHDSATLRGRSLYEIWRDDRAEFDIAQSYQTQQHARLVRSTHWASFVVTPQGETMYVGLYGVRYLGMSEEAYFSPAYLTEYPAGSLHKYDLIEQPYLGDYVGRIIIDWGLGTRSWVQRGDREGKPIIEIRRDFTEPAFPGFLDVILNLSGISMLPTAWRAALSAARGVYVLTCPRTKELYVGSATGDDGFLGRWQQYSRDGHGGNIQLRSRNFSDYQVSILEIAGSSLTAEDIVRLESHWKDKLQTRQMGLNSN